MARIFIALDLPEDVKIELAQLRYGIPGARWVDDDQLHLTISFVGEVDGGLLHDITEQLAGVHHRAFSFFLQGLGHFPPRGMPKILWVGVNCPDGLVQLRSKVDAVLRTLDVTLENRKFFPHITLARLKNAPRSRVANFIAGNNLYKSRTFEVDSFHLYSSVLTSKGAIHTLEQSYDLAG
jgi:2'-5' RNA ligase